MVREAANRALCGNNLKQIGLALHAFHEVRGRLPTSRVDTRQTWMVDILPFMEQEPLFRQWNPNLTYYRQEAPARETPLKAYFCPTRRGPDLLSRSGDHPDGTYEPHVRGALADYAANVGTTGSDYWWSVNRDGSANTPSNGVFCLANNWGSVVQPAFRTGYRFEEIRDGLGSTLMVGEKHVHIGHFGTGSEEAYQSGENVSISTSEAGAYYSDQFSINGGDSSAYNGDKGSSFRGAGPGRTLARSSLEYGSRFGSYHSGICQFVFCDGSVRGIRVSIAPATLGNLANRHDGQAVRPEEW
jgi:hypothetical protein